MADNHDCIICPACGKEMDKVFINSMNRNLDMCLNGCGGMFFDNREFEKVDEQNESIDEILSLIENKNFEKVDDTQKRVCSYCGANMVKHNVNGILIDNCYTCGAKFLDNNELIQYRSQYPNDLERSKVFHAMFSVNLKKQIAEDSITELQQQEIPETLPTEIVYSVPPMNPFKRFIVNLFNK